VNTEIDGIVRGYHADVQREILNHRTTEGAGLVASFASNVRRHADRAATKLRDLRAQQPTAVATIDAAGAKIEALAKTAIDRAEAAGRVEFAMEGV
jgi:hypothetical protein